MLGKELWAVIEKLFFLSKFEAAKFFWCPSAQETVLKLTKKSISSEHWAQEDLNVQTNDIKVKAKRASEVQRHARFTWCACGGVWLSVRVCVWVGVRVCTCVCVLDRVALCLGSSERECVCVWVWYSVCAWRYKHQAWLLRKRVKGVKRDGSERVMIAFVAARETELREREREREEREFDRRH